MISLSDRTTICKHALLASLLVNTVVIMLIGIREWNAVQFSKLYDGSPNETSLNGEMSNSMRFVGGLSVLGSHLARAPLQAMESTDLGTDISMMDELTDEEVKQLAIWTVDYMSVIRPHLRAEMTKLIANKSSNKYPVPKRDDSPESDKESPTIINTNNNKLTWESEVHTSRPNLYPVPSGTDAIPRDTFPEVPGEPKSKTLERFVNSLIANKQKPDLESETLNRSAAQDGFQTILQSIKNKRKQNQKRSARNKRSLITIVDGALVDLTNQQASSKQEVGQFVSGKSLYEAAENNEVDNLQRTRRSARTSLMEAREMHPATRLSSRDSSITFDNGNNYRTGLPSTDNLLGQASINALTSSHVNQASNDVPQVDSAVDKIMKKRKRRSTLLQSTMDTELNKIQDNNTNNKQADATEVNSNSITDSHSFGQKLLDSQDSLQMFKQLLLRFHRSK